MRSFNRAGWLVFIAIFSQTASNFAQTIPLEQAGDGRTEVAWLTAIGSEKFPLAAITPVNSTVISENAIIWILGLLTAMVVLLAVGIFMFWHRQPNLARIPLPPRVLLMPEIIPDHAVADAPSTEAWKQRALVAEAMVGKQGQLLRDQMIPELTEFAKQSLVQGLYAQRNMLMETQLKAQQALMELESRLNTVQAPLQERIRVYEKRIAELEREVETQSEEVRELTRATLTLVRRKLEDERENERLLNRFN